MMATTLRVTYKKSAIGYSQRQKDTIRSLGLKRLGQTVELPDNQAIRGMVHHVRHLVVVEEGPRRTPGPAADEAVPGPSAVRSEEPAGAPGAGAPPAADAGAPGEG
jgi:large subunit ribosomal protein L30